MHEGQTRRCASQAAAPAVNRPGKPDWYSSVSPYARPDGRKAIWQLVETLVPYAAVWAIMIWLAHRGHPYLMLALSLPAAGLLVRVFILFHDCCHGSFFQSRRANRIVGYVTGLITLTPFDLWQRTHAQHHATVGDLDRRGAGDVWTLTVDEYVAASRSKRLAYRVFRHPFVLFGVGAVIMFLFVYRFASRGASSRERFSVRFTNVGIAAVTILASLTIGFRTFVSIEGPVLVLASAAGVWLFYVQHQFEDVYWARHDAWDPFRAALAGSSYYKLPRVLQWFTGSIGLHHIHHVQPRIPSYALQRCQDGVAVFQSVEPLTIRRSLHSLRLRLWDERRQRMVSCAALAGTARVAGTQKATRPTRRVMAGHAETPATIGRRD
jgi:omega-6 fatty acid desaturase (delta-12 desaturase)